MPEMIIQHIVLPMNGKDDVGSLYAKDNEGSFPIMLLPGESINLGSFFNYFPSEKYRKYAGLNRIILRLDCDGEPIVVVTRCSSEKTETESYIYNDELQIELKDECLLGLEIKAETKQILIRNGAIYTDREAVNDVHLAFVICTFHKEEVVKNKLDLLCSAFQNDDTVRNNLKIYVIDNGRSLDYHNDMVTVIPSSNYGGSGGFTRGMIEAVHDGISTHIVLNDDDAILDPETIYRTLSFFRLIRDNTEIILGGTVLKDEAGCVVHEAGARFLNGNQCFNDCMDPSTEEGCIDLDRSMDGTEEGNYFAWCYMALSCDLVRRYGYALPLFFQADDVEYGLRTHGIQKMTMCGISVWHPFVYTHTVNKSYYSLRNKLIVCAINGQINWRTMKNILLDATINVSCYRYKSADAQMQAFHDFRKGPEHVFGMISENPVKFKEYDYSDCIDVGGITTKTIKHSRMFNIITMNGLFFPSIGNKETEMSDSDVSDYYRKGIVFYRNSNGKLEVCKRSRVRSLSLVTRMIAASTIILFRRKKYNRSYSESVKRYSNEEYWKKMFGNG